MTAKSQSKSLAAADATADDNISISALPSVTGSTTVALTENNIGAGHSSSGGGSGSGRDSGSKKWVVLSALALGAFIGFLGGIALSKGTIPTDFSFNFKDRIK